MLVRNITGTFRVGGIESTTMVSSGAFSLTKTSSYDGYYGGHTKTNYGINFSFSASRVISTDNENRPVNISAIPLIYVA